MSKPTEFTRLVREFTEKLNEEMDENKAYIVLTVDSIDDTNQLLIASGGQEWMQIGVLAEFAKNPKTKPLMDKAITFVVGEILEEMALAKEDEKEDLNQLLTILKNKN